MKTTFLWRVFLALYLLLGSSSLWAVQVGPDGSANYSLPIKVPPGMNGLQPSLSISYNSNAPNGMLGVGFQLQGLPAITRVNDGNGVNYDASDTFAGPGGRLYKVDSTNSIYHSEDEDWIEYAPYGNDDQKWTPVGTNGCGNGPCYWKAYTTDGKTMYFGGEENSDTQGRIEKTGSPAVRVWALSKVSDIHENSYSVTYDENLGQYYPSRIIYNFKDSDGSDSSHHSYVDFCYGPCSSNTNSSNRTDQETRYIGGGSVRTAKRLTRIKISTGEDILFGSVSLTDLIREYRIRYGYGGLTGKSRITSIKECKGAAGNECLPAKEFGWKVETNGFGNESVLSNNFSDARNWGSDPKYYSTIRFPDINGDGKSDVCGRQANGIICYLSTGTGFSSSYIWKNYFTDPVFSDPKYYSTIRFPDINGDGKSDVCGRQSNGIICYLSTGTGFSSSYIWKNYFANPVFSDPKYYSTIRFPDINGDGKSDVCGRQSNGIICYLSTGTGFSSSYVHKSHFTDPVFSDPKYYSTISYPDINGDGKSDVCGRQSNGIICYLSTGTGFSSSY